MHRKKKKRTLQKRPGKSSAAKTAKEQHGAKSNAAKAAKEPNGGKTSTVKAAKEQNGGKTSAVKAAKEPNDGKSNAAKAAKEPNGGKSSAAKTGTGLHRIRPAERRGGRRPALLLAAFAALLFGLSVCGFGGWRVPLQTPQKPPQAARAEKSAAQVLRPAPVPRPDAIFWPDAILRLYDTGRQTSEQAVLPVFASLFGTGRAAAEAYCGGLTDAAAPVIAGFAQVRLGEIRLSVPEVRQLPQLPNGCEATSLAALLRYRGFPANKLDLAYGYIPREDFTESAHGSIGPDPERAYAGDPAADLGFYCFAAPLAQGANRYLHEMGSSMHAFNVTGVTGEGLRQYIYGGDPVVVWITLDLSEPYIGSLFAWFVKNTGRVYTPYSNLHCVVLMGWGRDTCTLMDPLQGIRTVDRQAFLASFEQMGRRALVIH